MSTKKQVSSTGKVNRERLATLRARAKSQQTSTPPVEVASPPAPVIMGNDPAYVPGSLPRGTFGERLKTGLTKDKIDALKAEVLASPLTFPLLLKTTKYTLILPYDKTEEIKVKGKIKKVVTSAALRLNAMGVVNHLCQVTHGDYHPNRALKIFESLGYTVEGNRPLSYDPKAYAIHRAEVIKAEAEAKAKAETEAKRGEAIARIESLLALPKSRKVKAEAESVLASIGLTLTEAYKAEDFRPLIRQLRGRK